MFRLRIEQYIEEQKLMATGGKVLVALSGGADSVALLWGLYLLREKLGIRLAAAHFNHQLRGEESRRDAEFVRDWCDRLGVPLTLGTDVDAVSGATITSQAVVDALNLLTPDYDNASAAPVIDQRSVTKATAHIQQVLQHFH